VWLPETFLNGTVDPVVGLSFAAARVSRLKLGTHIVGPGRNPFQFARSLAQLDRISGGRLLLNLVAGLDTPGERAAQGLPTGNRTGWIDESLPQLRQWWSGAAVDGLVLDPLPVQSPLEVWLGGQAPAALARAGRLGDGWMPGAIRIADAVAGRAVVESAAAAAGRTISPEHFGINLSYVWGAELPALPVRRGDPTDVVAAGVDALRALVARWVDAGFSKVVVRPAVAPDDWPAELARLADAVLDLQT
jgi:probable F420-dependent oxidoreductase